MINGRHLPDARQLEAFIAMVREGVIDHAALDLGTSASNVRRMLRSLDQRAGGHLLRQGSDGVFKPTRLGTLVHEGAGEIGLLREELDRTVNEVHQRGRVLRVAAPEPWFASRVFGRLLMPLRAEDRIRAVPMMLSEKEAVAGLERGVCDLFVSTGKLSSRRLHRTEIANLSPVVLSKAGRRGDPPPAGRRMPKNHFVLSPGFALSSGINGTSRGGSGSDVRVASPSAFADWLDSEDPPESGVALDGEIDSERFPGAVWPCDDLKPVTLSIVHLAHHPFEILDSIVQRIASIF